MHVIGAPKNVNILLKEFISRQKIIMCTDDELSLRTCGHCGT